MLLNRQTKLWLRCRVDHYLASAARHAGLQSAASPLDVATSFSLDPKDVPYLCQIYMGAFMPVHCDWIWSVDIYLYVIFNKYKPEKDWTYLFDVAIISIVPTLAPTLTNVGSIVTRHCISRVHDHCMQRVLAVDLKGQTKLFERDNVKILLLS